MVHDGVRLAARTLKPQSPCATPAVSTRSASDAPAPGPASSKQRIQDVGITFINIDLSVRQVSRHGATLR